MQKTKKKYALRKTAAYGLVSCSVGLMLVGSVPTHADEREPLEFEMVTDTGAESEFTVFNWTGTFKSDKGEQLHDDAHLSAQYIRWIHEANNSRTADPWVLDDRTSDNMEDLNLEDHRFFGYGEPNTYSIGENVFTIPGRIGDYYLASYDGNNMQHIGQNFWYTLQDNIYNEIGKQVQIVNRESNFVYRQKDTKITLRLIDAENPEKVYHTVEVPAFTNYEHNDLDTHVFDSFKSEGELLDNLPNEVALENDGKTIDIRLKKTKAEIKVVYKNADGTVYKEFVVSADKGTILDASDLEMLPDDMEFNDDFMFYEVKGDGTDNIERIVKKVTSDQGSQTDNPDTSDGSTQTDTPDSKDNGTQTDKPDTSDGATQTKAEIKVVYKNADGTVYKEFVVNADKGTILDASDLEMLPDDMEFNDDFMFYEVKGDGTDNIERIVNKLTSDQGSQTDSPDTSEGSTQTDNPDTSDGGTPTDTPDSKDNGTQTDNPDTSDGSTQTKAEIKVVYKNADGTVYKEFVVNADKGTILGASDLEMLPDDMEFNDDFMFYEVRGDGTDNIERIVKKVTSDQGGQTDEPNKSDSSAQTDTPDSKDNGTQTDTPDTSDGGTQTDTPDSKDNGTQTDNPNTSDGSTQTDTPDSKDNGTQTDNPDTSDGGTQIDKPDVKDDATQTDRPKDEPTQSIPKQDGISEVKPLSNKAASGYTRVQPTKSVGHLSSAGQLPKAGSTDNSKIGLIGAAFALLGGMIGFVSRRKVHK